MTDNIKVAGSGLPGASSVATKDVNGVHIPIYATGFISTVNSTTTSLDNGETFTGDWEDVGHFATVTVALKTDQDGYFTVQFSPDGTNQDSTLTRYYRTAQIEAPHSFTITRQYCRVTFTNDSGSDQTYLRLQTLLGDRPQLNAPQDSILAQDFDATVVRPTDYRHEVAVGIRQGHVLWNKFGYNPDIDVGTELIANFGGSMGIYTTASTYDIVSSSTADDDGGTGCNSVVVYGLDSSWDTLVEVVTMDGTTTATTSGSFISYPNRVAMYLCGSGQTNAGQIDVTRTTGGAQVARLAAGEGVTQQCIFTVARAQQFIMEWLYVNAVKQSGQDPFVTFKFWVYSNVSNGKQEVARFSIDTRVQVEHDINPNLPFPISEKTICWVEATTDKADTICNSRFSGILIRDADH